MGGGALVVSARCMHVEAARRSREDGVVPREPMSAACARDAAALGVCELENPSRSATLCRMRFVREDRAASARRGRCSRFRMIPATRFDGVMVSRRLAKRASLDSLIEPSECVSDDTTR